MGMGSAALAAAVLYPGKATRIFTQGLTMMCVCVCVCTRARACVRACVLLPVLMTDATSINSFRTAKISCHNMTAIFYLSAQPFQPAHCWKDDPGLSSRE